MAEEGSGWEDTIKDGLVGEKLCIAGGIGDATTGYLLGHVFCDEEEGFNWDTLYNDAPYSVEVLGDDGETMKQVEVNEPTALKAALDASSPPAGGIYIGGKKFRAVQLQEFPAKSYDRSVKAYVIALEKLAGCIAIDGGYYVIGIINTTKNDNKNLHVELACDMAAYLASL